MKSLRQIKLPQNELTVDCEDRRDRARGDQERKLASFAMPSLIAGTSIPE